MKARRVCAECGKAEGRWVMFKVWKGAAHDHDFCSFECSGAYVRREVAARKAPAWRRFDVHQVDKFGRPEPVTDTCFHLLGVHCRTDCPTACPASKASDELRERFRSLRADHG